QTVAKTDRRRRLAFARRRRVDRRHQDQLAVLVALHRLDELRRNLRLVMAERQKMLAGNPNLRPNLLDRPLLSRPRNLNVGLKFSHRRRFLRNELKFRESQKGDGMRWAGQRAGTTMSAMSSEIIIGLTSPAVWVQRLCCRLLS